MKKKILILAIVIVVAIIAVIAGIKLKQGKVETNEDSLQRVLDKKTFILGVDDSFPPMGFRNEENEIVGFDIDVANRISDRIVEIKK